MESNWRFNVWKTGWSFYQPGVYPYPDRVTLVAELVTPFVVGGLLLKWVVQLEGAFGRYMVYGIACPLDTSQMCGFFSYLGTARFPGIYLVLPD